MATSTKPKLEMKLEITPDRLQVYLVLRAARNAADLTDVDVVDLLKKGGIVINDNVNKRVTELIGQIESGKMPTEPVLIAEGQAPIEPADAELVWANSLKQKTAAQGDDGATNFYERHQIVTVEPETIIGHIEPPRKGEPGVDIYGKSVLPSRQPKKISMGQNVELGGDGKTVKATSAGQVILEKGKLTVRDVFEVEGNIDFTTGNVDAAGDVLVRGSVKDLFIVKATRNISIKGMVDSAYMFAGADITIVGGVKGRGKAIMEAAGDVHAKFLDSVYLEAGGNVEIANESIDNVILCGGQLLMKYGVIIGGCQFAMGGMRAKTVGSSTGVKTVVGVGTDPRHRRRLLEIEQKIQKSRVVVEKIRQSVAPLLQQIKRLNAEQREQATELVFKADSLEMNINEMEEEKNKLLSAFTDPTGVELSVTSKIFPNTYVHVAHRVTTIREEITGPLRIVLRKVEGITEMVLISKLSGSMRTLPAQRVELNDVKLPEKPKIAQPGAKDKPGGEKETDKSQRPPSAQKTHEAPS